MLLDKEDARVGKRMVKLFKAFTLSNIVTPDQFTSVIVNFIAVKSCSNEANIVTKILSRLKLKPASFKRHPTWCLNEANMLLHLTMLDNVGPTCWLCLNKPCLNKTTCGLNYGGLKAALLLAEKRSDLLRRNELLRYSLCVIP